MTEIEAKQYYSPLEVAKMWGVSRQTVARLIRSRQLACVIIMGRYKISQEHIDDYIRRHTSQIAEFIAQQ